MARLTKGYITGKAQRVSSCQREIRICTPSVLGKIYTCSNFGRDEDAEKWMCIKVGKDYNNNIMQRVWPKK